MDLLEFISDSERRAKLAADTAKSPDYLWQIATGRRRASPALAQAIAANCPVTKESLRPDIWAPKKKAA
jgi:DNA-binding transcriptional regulator YdaS (Cro superfamily)